MSEWLPLIPAALALLTLIVVLRPMSHSRDRMGFRTEKQNIFSGTGGDATTVEITGHLQNKSTRVNNLAQLHLVVWLPKRRGISLFESGPVRIQEGADELRPHIRFDGKEDRLVTATWQITLNEDATPLVFEVLIEDSDRKLFNESGKLIKRKNIERRRQLTEWRFANIKYGGRRVRALRMKIVLSDAGFAIRRLFWFLGF